MTHVTCRLTAKNRDQLRDPTLGDPVWASFLPIRTVTEMDTKPDRSKEKFSAITVNQNVILSCILNWANVARLLNSSLNIYRNLCKRLKTRINFGRLNITNIVNFRIYAFDMRKRAGKQVTWCNAARLTKWVRSRDLFVCVICRKPEI